MVYQEMGPHDYPNKTIFFGWFLLNNAFGTPRLVSFVLPSAFCFSAQLFTGTWLEKSGLRSPVGGVGEEELCLENPCRGSWGCGRGSIAKAVAEGLNDFQEEKTKLIWTCSSGASFPLCFVYRGDFCTDSTMVIKSPLEIPPLFGGVCFYHFMSNPPNKEIEVSEENYSMN